MYVRRFTNRCALDLFIVISHLAQQWQLWSVRSYGMNSSKLLDATTDLLAIQNTFISLTRNKHFMLFSNIVSHLFSRINLIFSLFPSQQQYNFINFSWCRQCWWFIKRKFRSQEFKWEEKLCVISCKKKTRSIWISSGHNLRLLIHPARRNALILVDDHVCSSALE